MLCCPQAKTPFTTLFAGKIFDKMINTNIINKGLKIDNHFLSLNFPVMVIKNKYTDKPAKATAANDATAIKTKNSCSAISFDSNTCKV